MTRLILLSLALLGFANAQNDIISQTVGGFFPQLSTELRKSITHKITQECITVQPNPVISDILNTTRSCTASNTVNRENAQSCVDVSKELFTKYIGLQSFTPLPVTTNFRNIIEKCADGKADSDFPDAFNYLLGSAIGCKLDIGGGDYKTALDKIVTGDDLSARSTRQTLQAQCNVMHEFSTLSKNVISFVSRSIDSMLQNLNN